MAILDRDIAALCCGIYAYDGGPTVAWDYFDRGEDDGVCWAVKRVRDVNVIVFRGSTTLEDWKRDAEAFADPFDDDDIGPVHPGFNQGLLKVASEADAHGFLRNFIVTGHSLGAGRASIFTGYVTWNKKPPLSRVVFGEPRPGFQQLADVIKDVPGRSYRNGSGDGLHYDLVTGVPFSCWPELYVHPTRLTDVTAPPAPDDTWGPFSWHHMQLYVSALTTVSTSTP
jgi:hypothetical protein